MSDKKIAKIYYDAHVFLTKTGELYGSKQRKTPL